MYNHRHELRGRMLEGMGVPGGVGEWGKKMEQP